MSNELVQIETLKAVDVYNGEAVDDILEKIEAEARSLVADITTPQGREQIASTAYRVARSKTALDTMGKELIADAKKTVDTVNAERKKVRDRLDALKEDIRAPLTEWENKEKQRVANHEEHLDALRNGDSFEFPDPTSEVVEQRITLIDDMFKREWEEFGEKANAAFLAVKGRLNDLLESRKKYEAEQAELARLRKEEEERKQREHEERLKAEAAEKAKKEAEEKAAIQAAEEERKAKEAQAMIEAKRKEAEAKAKAAEDARIAAEAKAKQEAEDAKRRIEEAAKRAEAEKQAAVKAEQEKQAAKERAEREEREAREADMLHRQAVYNEALSGVQAAGIGENDARRILDAIKEGKVPNIRIVY